MNKLLWLFPVIFMLHELEEIIGLRIWLDKNPDIVNRYPLLLKIRQNFSYEGFAFAVLEQYLCCILIVLTAVYYQWYLIWMGAFIAFAIHLAVHIVQSAIIRRYVPAVLSSVILLPVSMAVLHETWQRAPYPAVQIITASIACVAVMIANLVFMHCVMKRITQKFNLSERKK